MKKNIILTIFAICICFLCCNKINALQCMYEDDDGSRIVLEQERKWWFGEDYVGYVHIIDSFKTDGEKIKAGEYTSDVFNDWKFIDEWKYVSSCPKGLWYDVETGYDNVYACDSWDKCGDKGDKKFYLIEGYTGETPEKVGLQEMVCTYESIEAPDDYTIRYNTYTFVITINNDNTMHYSLYNNYKHLYDNDVDLAGINNKDSNALGYSEKTYYDSFQPRVFWDSKDLTYKCAEQIAVTSECSNTNIPAVCDYDGNCTGGYNSSTCDYHIGYNEKGLSQEELDAIEIHERSGFLFAQRHDLDFDVYDLVPTASYIKYDADSSDYNICAYTYPNKVCNPEIDDCDPLTMLSLIGKENKNTGQKTIFTVLNDGYVETDLEINSVDLSDLETCIGLPKLYTDCFINSNKENCKVSDKEFASSEILVPSDWSNTQDASSVEEGLKETNGFEYRKLLCELSDRLNIYVPKSTLNTLPSLKIYSENIDKEEYKITNLDCEDWGITTGYRCDTEVCQNQSMYNVERKVTEIREYCNRKYKKYIENTIAKGVNERKEECFAFDDLYTDMVEKGIINDLSIGCDFVTSELAEKIIWILDLLKIAGPIAALGLGTLDFVKAIASGDADKEMKSAFKRFTTRMIAATLLFIIPLILAFMMDTFIGNQDGYDPDNPFCNVVDWT